MPDMTMCRNETCPLKWDCYRYCAMPDDIQSFACFVFRDKDNACSHFMKILPGDLLNDQKISDS